MACDPDDLPRPRRLSRRRVSVFVAVAAVAAASVVLSGDDDNGVEVGVGADPAGQTAPPPALTDASATTTAVVEGSGAGEAPTSTTGAATFTTAGRRPPTTEKRSTTTTRPGMTTTLSAPSSTTVPPVSAPLPPATFPTTAPKVCPAAPTSPWTLTEPGFYLVPIDGGAPRPVLRDAGLHPNEVVPSADGKRLIFSDIDWTENQGQNPFKVFTVNADGTDRREITTGLSHPSGFQWSPDGKWIAFHDQIRAETDIWVMAADGTQLRRLFTYPVPGHGWLRWAPDSTRLAASSANDGAGAWVIDRATGSSVRLVTEAVWQVDWSPDSKRLVVDLTDGSPPTGGSPGAVTTVKDLPIIVINADGTGRRQLTPGGVWAVWSPAGDGIALRMGGLIDPDTLVQRPYGQGSALAYSPDGQHLLATSPGLIVNDRQACGYQLVAPGADGTLSTIGFNSWAGNRRILVRIAQPA